jgi:uncharacterized protein (DUF433 family)
LLSNQRTMTRYITSTSNIIGGKPAIAGTRIPIARIIFLLKQGYSVKAIHSQYPWVERTVLAGAIDEITELVNNSPDVTKVSQIQTAA